LVCNGDQRIGFRRIAPELHRREVQTGQRANDLKMAQLFGADIHQEVFPGGVFAI
jgi:hypothetical protein